MEIDRPPQPARCVQAVVRNHVTVFTDPHDLIARVEEIRRAREFGSRKVPAEIEVGPLCIAPAEGSVTWNGSQIALSAKQMAVLTLLAEHAGQVVARDFIFEALWRNEPETGVSLVNHQIMKIRQRLGDGAALIETIPGKGYCLRAPDMATPSLQAGS